ncbi:MAG: Fe-S cluster assembly ATPase SufC [Candidatus Buchananbacteria bacterium CG10_big_fil_rev_8_21_14_0_10_42_9]|uniref:Fe-S cluster assembly ATPase SufC n=1 Tax=Candidatus Buchananbacteria bacterium CG10_big_fil_rev_8_21_14_0_10_42_9 TaxID=1974526 RepID=A0A2H0W024_9BACT|nr:MAG: Fe-S cluster assembly ATPase SufC [Candidatus Buchananbacteria bacterium CG10_big_fil_rev_8_21_14_0_10_42_9]
MTKEKNISEGVNKLEVKNLSIATDDGKDIVKNASLKVDSGEVVVLMGPNGSGKSTLANAIVGNPKFEVTSGEIILNKKKLNKLSPDKRAKHGLFMSFQYPSEIPGVSMANFLRTAWNNLHEQVISVSDFKKLLEDKMGLLKIPSDFAHRYLNTGFSGGEKKKSEILQLAVLEPKFAILDETDSGTDIDSLQVLAGGINQVKQNTNMGILLITHYNRILQYIKPDKVYVMVNGIIVKEGKSDLVQEIETNGYKLFVK